ncbi:mandelate racemase/muconate lactonizing enzyme family protein [Oceanobacillus rekensis]|uniref:mandelate racemase/muconate lactonizing enzyme family protein n=1 Tax=Oceanobacillus rekensis TaxID=937927 RepID=UPI000B434848|nr:dipeptide epimerase [Oceanobacillus rekensis]
MQIQSIETFRGAIPLHTPFKTALRTVTVAETIIVKVTCDDGTVGWGEAPPTHVITGDSMSSIQYAIEAIFKPLLIGESLIAREQLFEKIEKSMVRNTSAKAAIDMALYDCIAQLAKLPLHQFLGGYHERLETDYTVSVNSPEDMAADARKYINDGFSVLKIKVGKNDIATDIERIKKVRKEIGPKVVIRLDANQGWQAKEAVRAIRKMEELGLDIELMEQPVKAHDLEGLKYVTNHTETPIMADESVFLAHDAKQVLDMGAADLINIKLMKAGGIHEAIKIAKLSSIYGVDCMVGSMIETKIGITAAAHFAASQPNVTRYDFDAPLMLKGDIANGGITYHGSTIELGNEPGLGIKSINDSFILEESAGN